MFELILIPKVVSIIDELVVFEEVGEFVMIGKILPLIPVFFNFGIDLYHQIYIKQQPITAIYL